MKYFLSVILVLVFVAGTVQAKNCVRGKCRITVTTLQNTTCNNGVCSVDTLTPIPDPTSDCVRKPVRTAVKRVVKWRPLRKRRPVRRFLGRLFP